MGSKETRAYVETYNYSEWTDDKLKEAALLEEIEVGDNLDLVPGRRIDEEEHARRRAHIQFELASRGLADVKLAA